MSTINLDNIRRSVALISDMHVGGEYSLWPDEPIRTISGLNYTEARSKGQLEIAESWHSFVETCSKFNVDTVVNLADTTAGVNPKESGRLMLTPDLELQKDAAVQLLEPLVEGRSYHAISGSKYHESIDTQVHRDIAHRLKTVAEKSQFHGVIANLKLKGTNKIMNVAHKATGALIYPATVLDRERIFVKMAEARDQLPHINYLVRGHLHHFFHLDYPDMHIIQLPCWQAWLPIGDRVRLYGRMQPDIGGVILLIDKQNRTIILHFLYPVPKLADMIINA